MTGLKSGAGDDLWGEESSEEDASGTGTSTDPEPSSVTQGSDGRTDEGSEGSTASGGERETGRPYVVRRAIRDKSVQFERDERLTFFVHDDVAEGERELVSEVEAALGRDVPKFDVREAVYRAALRNREDVLEELLEMGYTAEE